MFCRVFCILNVYTVEGMFMYTWQQLVYFQLATCRGGPLIYSPEGEKEGGGVSNTAADGPRLSGGYKPLSA